MTIDHHQRGINALSRLYDEYQNDYEQLRQLTYMILGASFMLAPASPEAQELEAFRQKVETRISQVLGVNDYLDADELCREQTLARAEAAKPLLPQNGSAAMRI